MKKFIFILFLFSLIFSSTITEYKQIHFYPNESQTVINDWLVINITQKFGVNLSYHNYSSFIPFSTNYEEAINKTPSNISINGICGDPVLYRIKNNYSEMKDIYVYINISSSYLSCGNHCFSITSVGPTSIVHLQIPSNSYGDFRISSIYSIPSSEISFNATENASVLIGANTILSITKWYNQSLWHVNYSIYNKYNGSVIANGSGWVENETKHMLINFSVNLQKNQTVVWYRNVTSNGVPKFYLQYNAYNTTKWNVTILPVKQSGSNFVIGRAVVEGFVCIPSEEEKGKEETKIIGSSSIGGFSYSIPPNESSPTKGEPYIEEIKKREIKYNITIPIYKKAYKPISSQKIVEERYKINTEFLGWILILILLLITLMILYNIFKSMKCSYNPETTPTFTFLFKII